MKTIKLSNDDTILIKVDDEDFERLNEYSWSVNGQHRVSISRGSTKWVEKPRLNGGIKMVSTALTIPIANEVMRRLDCKFDHKDNDFTNNQKENLRECTYLQNAANKKKYCRSSTSKYKGIRLHAKGKWTAQLQYRRKQIYIGYFDNEEEAARAYDRKAIEIWGEFASLNFPAEQLEQMMAQQKQQAKQQPQGPT